MHKIRGGVGGAEGGAAGCSANSSCGRGGHHRSNPVSCEDRPGVVAGYISGYEIAIVEELDAMGVGRNVIAIDAVAGANADDSRSHARRNAATVALTVVIGDDRPGGASDPGALVSPGHTAIDGGFEKGDDACAGFLGEDGGRRGIAGSIASRDQTGVFRVDPAGLGRIGGSVFHGDALNDRRPVKYRDPRRHSA